MTQKETRGGGLLLTMGMVDARDSSDDQPHHIAISIFPAHNDLKTELPNVGAGQQY